jgi:thymidylate synthase
MNSVDKQYFELLKHILRNGVKKTDRTGTGTISVFDYTMRFNMNEGFPLLTSKKMFTKGVIHELIWFLRGDTNIKYLQDNDVHIWDGDYNKSGRTDGELGPIYGKQWRSWGKDGKLRMKDGDGNSFYGEIKQIDQIANLVNDLKNNPDSRRLMVSAWNVGEIDQMTLPPCHYGFQCYTSEMNTFERKQEWCKSLGKSIHYAEDLTDVELDTLKVPRRRLSLKWNQRSVDTFLGLPFNIASYGLLLHVLAREVNMVPNELIFSGGDVHLYTNHIEVAKEQLNRETFKLCKLVLSNKSIDDLKYEDFQIIDYKSDKVLKGELSN